MEEALVELATKQDEVKKTEGGKEEGERLDLRGRLLRIPGPLF